MGSRSTILIEEKKKHWNSQNISPTHKIPFAPSTIIAYEAHPSTTPTPSSIPHKCRTRRTNQKKVYLLKCSCHFHWCGASFPRTRCTIRKDNSNGVELDSGILCDPSTSMTQYQQTSVCCLSVCLVILFEPYLSLILSVKFGCGCLFSCKLLFCFLRLLLLV